MAPKLPSRAIEPGAKPARDAHGKKIWDPLKEPFRVLAEFPSANRLNYGWNHKANTFATEQDARDFAATIGNAARVHIHVAANAQSWDQNGHWQHITTMTPGREPLIPATMIPDLAESEIQTRMLAKTEQLISQENDVRRLSSLTYGNVDALNLTLIEARAPGFRTGRLVADEAADAIEGNTALDHEHRVELAVSLRHYGELADNARNAVLRDHSAEQRRAAKSVPAPSRDLALVLNSPPDTQTRIFAGNKQLQRELGQLATAFANRLSPADNTTVRTGNMAALAKSLGVSQERAGLIAKVRTQAGAASKVVAAVPQRSPAAKAAVDVAPQIDRRSRS